MKRALVGLVLAFSSMLAAASILPQEVGLSVYSIHGNYNKGPYKWNNTTQGVYGLWDIGKIGDVSVKALGASIELSTGRQGTIMGVMLEKEWVFTSIGVVSGYEKAIYHVTRMPGSTSSCHSYCFWRTAENQLRPYFSVGVKVSLPDNWKIRLSYQPKPPGGATDFWQEYRDMRKDRSITLWLGRTF